MFYPIFLLLFLMVNFSVYLESRVFILATIVTSKIQDGHHGRYVENLIFVSSPEPKGLLT